MFLELTGYTPVNRPEASNPLYIIDGGKARKFHRRKIIFASAEHILEMAVCRQPLPRKKFKGVEWRAISAVLYQ